MAVFYKSAFTRDMLREASALADNTMMICQNQCLSRHLCIIPLLFV